MQLKIKGNVRLLCSPVILKKMPILLVFSPLEKSETVPICLLPENKKSFEP